MCTSFKDQLLEAVHDFRSVGGDTFKLALYSSAATLSASTTAYTTSNEVAASGSYSAGGGTLTNISPTTSGTTAFTDFDDISFTAATINARGALIYNTTPTHTYTNPAVVVLDFGGDKISTAGTFTIQFPTASASDAIIRIA
jgi:alpha-L-fucosidase